MWGCDHADRRTCAARLAEKVPVKSAILYTDAWPRAHGSPPAQAPGRHGIAEGAREDEGDGRREGPCHAGEGAGAALRTDLRAFRGVHKPSLPRDVAT